MSTKIADGREYLCIGGPWDGQRIETDGRDFIQLIEPYEQPLLYRQPCDFHREDDAFKVTTYMLGRLTEEGIEYQVYFWSQNKTNVIKTLLEGYRRPVQGWDAVSQVQR